MKVTLTEHEGCFDIELVPETMQEVSQCVRFGMNRTAVRSVNTHVFRDAEVRTNIVFGKSKRADSNVPKRK
jgi:hypothetical protein